MFRLMNLPIFKVSLFCETELQRCYNINGHNDCWYKMA